MPLYEFYCAPCHTVFTFRSGKVDTETVPPCPVCGAPLSRQVSAFSHSVKGSAPPAPDGEDGGGEDGYGGPPDANEAACRQREELIARMTERLENMGADDADPADAVRVMREISEAGGLAFKPEVAEAMARIEAGEDPDKIDEEFSEVFDTEDPFAAEAGAPGGRRLKPSEWLRRLRPPRRDPVWHDL